MIDDMIDVYILRSRYEEFLWIESKSLSVCKHKCGRLNAGIEHKDSYNQSFLHRAVWSDLHIGDDTLKIPYL